MTNQNKSYIYAIISVLLWSTVAVAFKISLEHNDYLQLLFISCWISTISILIITLLKITKQNSRNRLFFIEKKQLLFSSLLGFLNPFLYYIVLFKAYSLLPASLAQPLNYTWVIVIAILSIIFLKQKINYKQLLALIISFIGVVIIASKGKFELSNLDSPLGILLATGSSLIWGFFWILNIKSKIDGEISLFYNFLFGSIYITIALIIFSNFNFNFIGIISAVYVGLFEMGITFVLWLRALKNSSNTALIGNIVYLSPFISLLFIILKLEENIHYTTFIGLVLIISGAITQNMLKKSV